jgi:hypothetical protein
MIVGQSVKVVKDKVFGTGKWVGMTGRIASIHKSTLPVGVVLKGERHETDFKKSELKVIKTR